MERLTYEQAEMRLLIHNIQHETNYARLNVQDVIDTLCDKYDIMTEYYGHDAITEELFQEASLFKKQNKDSKDLSGLNFMRFNNKGIIEAIEHFNNARARFKTEDETKVDMYKLIDSVEFKKGIASLEKQFDCKIKISNILGTLVGSATIPRTPFTYFSKIKISKSEGFKLGGMPIIMGVGVNEGEAIVLRSTPETFGQSLTSIILHEIWHNISVALHTRTTELMAATSTIVGMPKTMAGKQRRILIMNYIETIERFLNTKVDRKTKKKLIKRLAFITSTRINKKTLNQMLDNPNNDEDFGDVSIDVEKRINDMFISYDIRNSKPHQCIILLSTVFSAFIAGVLQKTLIKQVPFAPSLTIPLNIIAGIMLMCFHGKSFVNTLFDAKDYEEYNADLFASMYQLPVVFKIYDDSIDDDKKGWVPNEFKPGDLKIRSRLNKLNHISINDVHPGNYERNYSSYKIAVKLLENGDALHPSIKKYLEWIVANFSSLKDLNLDEMYDSKLFEPAEAEMLDKHLEQIARSKRVSITEYDMMMILCDGIIIQG